jgi:hypothetical protein
MLISLSPLIQLLRDLFRSRLSMQIEILAVYCTYYHAWRTHLSLEMDCPEPREIQAADRGRMVKSPEVGGLHHHYQRLAA